MAIFEKKIVEKVTLDDTETITCVIENSQTINGHTEYALRVQRGPIRSNCWRVYRRYNDFISLHNHLQTSCISLPLPPKKLIGNMSRDFIAERQAALQNYINIVLMNPILASSLATKKFVDPDNYSTPFQEVALQHVSLALRGEVGWEVMGPLGDIGWRLRKHYFQVRNRSNPKDELLASWVEYGPDKYLDEKDLQLVFKSLLQLKHPNIYPFELCLCTEVGGLTVRKFGKNGSLRDLLCGAKPKQSFLKKYGNPKGHKPLTERQIIIFSRQILETLSFLHEKGVPYGHLHTGNIFIENDDTIKLLDIENGVLGVPSFYRPYFVQHKKISTLESIDVYSFGHTLFEMVFGRPLHESVCDNFPNECSPLIKSVLDSILSSEACRNGLPTINNLLSHKCFTALNTNNVSSNHEQRAHLKFSTAIKEKLKYVSSKIEERLKDEQKLVRSQKRIARVQEMMSTEEEKKKRRHKKHESKEIETKEQLPKEQLTLNGVSPDRSESVNSGSTATSIGTVTPPSSSGLQVMDFRC
ncbi:PX domain-containing protein kinase-like protein [Chrysoperla carnea]|uniref:PX domain-containing protein kinase-like protein n=1 Tax=Chrysoperla carnea TaxID=189513 RepID=UPI001D06C24F|nr:PX domain-containing protein kinase-like protein [Chrysoperla carnea]